MPFVTQDLKNDDATSVGSLKLYEDAAANRWGASVIVTDVGGTVTLVGSANPLPVDTELPAAAALADATANPTVPAVGAFLHLWNSATWDRCPGDQANGVTVNLGVNNDVTITGGVAISSVVPGTGATNLGKAEDAAHASGDVGVQLLAVRKAVPANLSGADGDYEPLQVNAGRLWVDASGVTMTVDGSGVTQPISAASLPLPTGAATLGEQQSQTTQVTRIAGKYVDFDTGAGTDSVVAIGLLLPAAGGAVIGGTASNPIRTDPTGATAQPISAASLPLPTGAATETGNLAAAAASLNVIDDWDETDRCKVNLIVGVAGITAGAGAVAAGTPRLTLASDDPAVVSLGVLDDWDEADRAKVNIIAGQVGVAANSGAADALTQRVILATNDPAVNSLAIIDDWDDADRCKTVQHAATSGGWTPYKLNSAASTNATSVKASAGQVGFVLVTNTNAAVRYLKLYNKASAPTVGTDTPVQVYAIPGATTGGGVSVPIPNGGLEFTTGIALAITTGAADSDTGAVAANEIIVNLGHK